MTGVSGSVLLRKLKTGQTAQVRIATTKQLFQLYTYDAATKQYSFGDTDWTDAANAPQCSIEVTGGGLTVSGVLWYIGSQLASSLDGCEVSGNKLTIKRNVAADLGYSSGTLKATFTVTDAAGNDYSVEKTEEIRVQQAVGSGYVVMVSANPASLNDSVRSLTLTATVYRGTGAQAVNGTSTSGLYVAWFLGNTATTEKAHGTTCTVNGDDVDGSQLVVAKAYVDGTWTDSEGYVVVDSADPYYITADVTQYATASSTSGTTQKCATSVNVEATNAVAKVAFRAMRKSDNSEVGASGWKVRKYHADTMKYISGSSSSASYTGDTDSDNAASGSEISVYDGDYISNSGGANHQTEVICDAECTV